MHDPRDPQADVQIDVGQIRTVLRQIVADVVGADPSEIDDDVPLLDIVTSSLALVEGLRRLYDRYGVLVSIRRIVEAQAGIEALALYVTQALQTQQPGDAAADAVFGQGGVRGLRGEVQAVPLAPSQQHTAFLTRYSPGAAAAQNEALAVRLVGHLDGPALQAAILAVANRYEALRTALARDTDALEIGLDERVELRVSWCAPDGLERRLTALASQPFEAGERLFRADLLRLSDSEHILVLVSHALVLGSGALALVLEDVAEVYRTAVSGGIVDLTLPPGRGGPDDPLGVQWTTHLARRDAEPDREASEAWWRERFAAGVPRLDLPADRLRPPVKSYAGAQVVVPVPPDLEARLRTGALSTTPETATFAAFAVLLHRLARQEAIVVGAEVGANDLEDGRRVVATEAMLPLCSSYDPHRSFAEQVRALATALDEVRAHREVSLAEVIQALDPPRDQSRTAIFSAAFRAAPNVTAPSFAPLEASVVGVPTARARYDLELVYRPTESGAALCCEYSTELFSVTTVTRWLNGLLEMLRATVDDPERPCGVLPIMPPDDLQTILANFQTWGTNETAYPRDRTAFDLIAERAHARAEQPAVRFGETTLTYGQLLGRVDAIAARLHAEGVRAGDRVGVLLPRSPDLVAALLATWRVGVVYVPLDAAFPRQRLAFMAEDAATGVVVTSRSLLDLAAGLPGARPLVLDDLSEQAGASLAGVVAARASGSAYIMYTSGSTGTPKGVEVGHRGLTNMLASLQATLRYTAADSFLAITTASFDISLLELLLPLVAGGVVEIGEDGLVADGIALAARIEAHRPSFVQATPSTWKAVLAAGWRGDPDLTLISTGEALSRALAEQLLTRGRAVWNLYGPTETTVFSTAYQVVTAPDEPMRIGRPTANTSLYILDDLLQPVPIGAVGELFIGGDGLAHGYWQHPDLTAERFIPNPFRPGQRLYRTGDLARYLSDGDVICLERLDDQVKIHGVRVEPGEIEAALRAVDGVRDAAVTTWTDPSGSAQLVAHIVAEGGRALETSEVRARLRERLPETLVPPHALFTQAFPLTANGKIARAALPAPETGGSVRRTSVAPPETPTEQQLAEAWARILDVRVGSIGRDDGFLDLGGHSLLMTPLLLEVRGQFGVTISIRELFGALTLRQLAALIEEKRAPEASERGRPVVQARGSEWGKQRMDFLLREAELPASIAPARGVTYRPRAEIRSLLLTGATGFIGGQILARVLRTTDVDLYCLVRPRGGESARARVERQLREFQLWRDDPDWQESWDRRVTAVEGDVTLPRLGLDDQTYETLARDLDGIVHAAAYVNFIYPYEALRTTNVLGVHEIIRLAFHRRVTPVHYVSTAAIWPMGSDNTFYERDSIEHGEILSFGYDESKWVGERCLLQAADRGLPLARYRPGEVGGDSVTGRCVLEHFILASIKGFLELGVMPDLDMDLDVSPADYVAAAVVHLALQESSLGRAFHLTNPRPWPLRDALAFFRRLGYEFQERPYSQIRDEMFLRPDFASNALFPYQAILMEMDDRHLQIPQCDSREALRALEGSGIVCPPVGEELLGAYIRYVWSVGYLPRPTGQPVGAGHAVS